jgi:hypothetical protein
VHRKGNRPSCAVAVFAALLLLVHSVALSWGAGAMSAGPMLDRFGNPLCITSGEQDLPTQQHDKVPSCCTLGCMSAGVWSAGATGDNPSYLLDLPVHLAVGGRAVHAHRDRPEYRQNGARAPPVDI